ncbi:MAG: DUF1631 family protein [Rubrivivax sp.]
MTTPAALQQFVDDELMRAPLLAEQVIEESQQATRRDGGASLTPRERALLGDVQRSLLANRPLVVREFVRSLSEQVRHVLADEESTRNAPPSGLGGLSLVDETQVEVDVEVARAIEAIRSIAEHELRELMSYTSALVGDMDVARDYNPFRPEVMARAMWSGAQALPLKRPYQLAFLRQVTPALAQLVRKAYAGACSRLESMGVEPAVYRTIIVFGSRRTHGQQDSFLDPQANRVDSTGALPGAGGRPVAVAPAAAPAAPAPAPGAARPTIEQVLTRTDELLRGLPANSDRQRREQLRNLQAQQLADSAASATDRELVELIGRLFDTVVGDRRLETDIQNLVSRLQAPSIRVALRDPALLDNYTHPVWLLMDRMALQGPLHPPPGDPERTRMLRFMHGLLDTLAQEQPRDADAFRWARERVMSYERVRFEQRRSAAEAELHSLQALEDQAVAGGTPPTSPGALDVGHLDTVPADLLDTLSATDAISDGDESSWLQSRRSGDWVRMFMQGAWVHAQLLWYGRHREYWLFADGASANTWAVRRGALERMLELKLLTLLLPRSLIRDAAGHVLRKLSAAG